MGGMLALANMGSAASAGLDPNNPIQGTPLDPNRRAYLRMQTVPGLGAPGVGGDSQSEPPESASSTSTSANNPEEIPTPTGAAALSRGGFNVADRKTLGTGPGLLQAASDTTSPTTTPTPTPTPGSSALSDDDILRALLPSNADNLASSKRVADLQSQYDAMNKPPTIKQRLLNVLVHAAPMVAAGIMGGGEAVGGAAHGEIEADVRNREHFIQDRNLVATQLEQERQRQERQLEHRASAVGAYGNLQLAREFKLGQLRNAADANVIRGRGVDAREEGNDVRRYGIDTKAETDRLKLGLDADGSPIPLEKLPVAQQAKVGLARADADLAQARESLVEAQTKALPEELALRRKAYQIALDRFKMAQDHYDRTFEANYYGTDAAQDHAPIPGAPVDDNGNVTGFKAGSRLMPSGQGRSRAEQADALIPVTNDLIKYIGDNREHIGNMEAIVKSAFMNTPLSDPFQSELASRIRSWAAMNPALHGFRGTEALQEFAKLVGGNYNDPDSMIGALKGMLPTANAVKAAGTPKSVPGRPAGSGALRKSGAVGRYNPDTGKVEMYK